MRHQNRSHFFFNKPIKYRRIILKCKAMKWARTCYRTSVFSSSLFFLNSKIFCETKHRARWSVINITFILPVIILFCVFYCSLFAATVFSLRLLFCASQFYCIRSSCLPYFHFQLFLSSYILLAVPRCPSCPVTLIRCSKRNTYRENICLDMKYKTEFHITWRKCLANWWVLIFELYFSIIRSIVALGVLPFAVFVALH